jgi:hypothetical protein
MMMPISVGVIKEWMVDGEWWMVDGEFNLPSYG